MSGAVSYFDVFTFGLSLIEESWAQHTVNEKAGIDAHLQIVKFVHALIQGANDYEGQE